jgi:hypothetical protein
VLERDLAARTTEVVQLEARVAQLVTSVNDAQRYVIDADALLRAQSLATDELTKRHAAVLQESERYKQETEETLVTLAKVTEERNSLLQTRLQLIELTTAMEEKDRRLHVLAADRDRCNAAIQVAQAQATREVSAAHELLEGLFLERDNLARALQLETDKLSAALAQEKDSMLRDKTMQEREKAVRDTENNAKVAVEKLQVYEKLWNLDRNEVETNKKAVAELKSMLAESKKKETELLAQLTALERAKTMPSTEGGKQASQFEAASDNVVLEGKVEIEAGEEVVMDRKKLSMTMNAASPSNQSAMQSAINSHHTGAEKSEANLPSVCSTVIATSSSKEQLAEVTSPSPKQTTGQGKRRRRKKQVQN